MSLSTFYYDPFHEPLFTVSDLNRLFDAAFDTRAPTTSRELSRTDDTSRALRPRMDLHGSKDRNQMTATFELPGMRKEDVDIQVHDDHLVVSGQSSKLDTYDDEGYAVRERRYGRFSRTLPLPSGVKAENIEADMNNGILTVTFPSSLPEKEAKRITIS